MASARVTRHQQQQLANSDFNQIETNQAALIESDEAAAAAVADYFQVKLEQQEHEIFDVPAGNSSIDLWPPSLVTGGGSPTQSTTNQTTDFGSVSRNGLNSTNSAVSSSSIMSLMPIEDGSERRYNCDQCEKTFKSSSLLSRHRNTHQGIRFDCTFEGCTASYAYKTEFTRHIRRVHTKHDTLYRCGFEGCRFSTYLKDYLIGHQKRVHKIKNPKQSSSISGEKVLIAADNIEVMMQTPIMQTLPVSELSIANSLDDYPILPRKHSFNKRQFKFKMTFKQNDESGKAEEPRFECPFEGCLANYSHRSEISRHVQREHTKKAQLLQCSFEGCQYNTYHSDYLKRHWRRTHRMKNPVRECRFNQSSANTHSGQNVAKSTENFRIRLENLDQPATSKSNSNGIRRRKYRKRLARPNNDEFDNEFFISPDDIQVQLDTPELSASNTSISLQTSSSALVSKLSDSLPVYGGLQQNTAGDDQTAATGEANSFQDTFDSDDDHSDHSCKREKRFKYRNVHDGRRFECPFEGCSTSYSFRSDIRKHIKSVHSNQSGQLLRCNFGRCHYTTRNKDYLNKHWIRKHRMKNPINRQSGAADSSADPDDEVFISADYIQVQLETPDLESFDQQVSNSSADSSSILMDDQPSDSSLVSANGGLTVSNSFAGTLADSAESGTNQQFNCYQCKMSFSQRSDLYKHRRLHEGKRFQCPFDGCTANYSHRSEIGKHVQREHTKKDQLLRCNLEDCDYTTYHKDYLCKHWRRKHRLKNPTPEDFQTFIVDPDAEPGTEIVPKKKKLERMFQCEHCDKSFRFQSVLDIHRNTHEKKRFQCQIEGCGIRYSYKTDLAKHIRRVHANGEDPRELMSQMLIAIANQSSTCQ